MDGNRSQTQYDNAEIDKLIVQHGNNECFMMDAQMRADGRAEHANRISI